MRVAILTIHPDYFSSHKSSCIFTVPLSKIRGIFIDFDLKWFILMYESVSMKKEDLLKIIESNPDSYVQIVKSKHKDFYDKIKQIYLSLNF